MKILFTTFPGLGHFFSIVPLAWAARAAGHEVLIITTGPAAVASGRAGLPTVDAAPGTNIMADLHNDLRDKILRARREMGPNGFAHDPFSNMKMWPIVAERMATVSDKMADRIVEVARWWQPDLVIHTPLEAAGPLAAALLSVPTVLHGIGPTGLGPQLASSKHGLMNHIYQALRPTFERHSLAREIAQPLTALDICPPSMREPEQSSALSMRYIPYNGGDVLPDWLMQPPSRRRICVTLGTVVPRAEGLSGLSGVIKALSDLDVEVILALGESDPSALGTLPPNVRASGWVPLSALVPTCTAIVHHGGSGTTMNALVAGVPQLVLPHMADQHMNAAAVQRRGVGLTHRPEEADTETVRRSLNQLLEDPGFIRAADDVRQENVSLLSPSEILTRLSEMVS